MSSAQVTLSGSSSVPGGVSLQLGPYYITSAAPINENLEVVLQSGDNQILIPSGTTLIVVQLPLLNAVATTLEGAASGTTYGLPMNPAGGLAVYEPTSAETSFYLHAATTHTAGATTITFI